MGSNATLSSTLNEGYLGAIRANQGLAGLACRAVAW